MYALMEEGRPFWWGAWAGAGGEWEVRDERNSVIIQLTGSVTVTLIEDGPSRRAKDAGIIDGVESS